MKNNNIYHFIKEDRVELGLEEYGAMVDIIFDEFTELLSMDKMDGVLRKFAEEGFHLDVIVNSVWNHYENE